MKNFVIFGASGDLARNYLFPSLYRLWSKGNTFTYFGYARTNMLESDFQKLVEEATGSKEFSKLFSYVSGEYDETGLQNLKEKLEGETIFYSALPTRLEIIEPLVKGMKKWKLMNSSKLVLEKPFGTDFESAKKLKDSLEESLGAEKMFLVDHYLSKELVRNLVSLRFANPILSKLWNREFIKEISILVVEERGVEGRGGYYDKTGEIRDMIQNHCLQLLALTVMDCPEGLNFNEFSKRKLAVLNNLSLYSSTKRSVKLGQYRGYLEVAGVEKDSKTETFVEAKFKLKAKGWEGVPITVTSGKKMGQKLTEINIIFKTRQTCLWGVDSKKFVPNQLSINLSPDNDIALTLNSSFDPETTLPKPVKLKLGSLASSQPYDKVILDAVNGNRLNSPSFEEILAQWKIVDTILASEELREELFCY